MQARLGSVTERQALPSQKGIAMTSDITVTYSYRNDKQHGEKTVVFHDCTDSKSARDYAAKVTSRALDSDTEVVLDITCDEGWILTTIVSMGEAHTLYLGKDGIRHRKLS